MRLSRTGFVPMLAIVAGGVIGGSLSFSFLALAPSGDVRVIAPIVSVEVLRLEAAKANSMEVYFIEQVEALRRLQEAQRDPPDQFRGISKNSWRSWRARRGRCKVSGPGSEGWWVSWVASSDSVTETGDS